MKLAPLFLVAVLGAAHAQQPSDRQVRWSEDLHFFAGEFPAHMIDFAKLYQERAFREELAVIEASIPTLTDAQIAMRLMRLVAKANDAHTNIYLPVFKLGFRQLPVTFAWYADGLAVTEAGEARAAALGTAVLKIGEMTPQQVLAAVAPYVPHENDASLRQFSTLYLKTLEVLQQVGAAGADGHVTLTLAKPGGEPFVVTVGANPLAKMITMFDALPIPMALCRKHPDRIYWYEYITESRALYVQYNSCREDPKLSFSDFARDLFSFAAAHAVERVVVDVRFNAGGSSRVINPLISGLKSRPALRSHVYVLIGEGTFSSAQDNAIALRKDLNAVLIGQPTGERPNGYGEVKALTLPNSGLKMQYSTKYFHMARGDPPALTPDLHVERTLVDALAGRDPVLDAALQHQRR
jgi:hypothetical protein